MKTYLLIISLALFLNSCSDIFSENDVKGVEARLIFAGSEASDGCGWLLVLSEEEKYKPSSLSEEFKVNGLAVKVSFKELDTIYSCGFPSVNSPEYQNVKITKIDKI
ncbi:hypothetical protein [Algoriphagus sp. NG3]|uniref:hypothetical protein n=1 Tax=Algoriphagus sp. NG3 TaxID=3097546 RepID=UPI002A83D89D|nr:hypothetical protein [Algoriphagus sp. NG3]WPR74828.1 hypothetical protein SLW71_19360 [Algoriphagus sp. NG3]